MKMPFTNLTALLRRQRHNNHRERCHSEPARPSAAAARSTTPMAALVRRPLFSDGTEHQVNRSDVSSHTQQSAPAITTTRAVEHTHIVTAFVELTTEAERLVRAHHRRNGRSQKGELVARLIAAITAQVLQSTLETTRALRSALNASDSDTVDDLALASLITNAENLKRRIATIGNTMTWDFAAVIGVPPDLAIQEPWKTSLPDAPVRAVVSPALRLNGQVIVRQQVYTMTLRESIAL
jgi:hypothetical protein